MLNRGWLLDTARAQSSQESDATNRGFRYYMTSRRLRRDFLWHPEKKLFAAVFAFSKWCRGPPGRVHGGCQFAALDDAIRGLLFSRGATDLGVPPGIMLTGGMQVDYKGPVPVGAVSIITCRALERTIDRKGRCRLKVEATIRTSEDGNPLSTGMAEFVAFGGAWEGQALPLAKQSSL